MLGSKNWNNNLCISFYYIKNGMFSIIYDKAMFYTDFIMGTLSPFLVQLILWNTIFTAQIENISGFRFYDIIFYYAFALIFSRVNNGYDIIRTLSHHIKEGMLEVYLTKPSSYLAQRLFTFLGESVLYIILLMIVFMVKILLNYENDVTFYFCIMSSLLVIFIIIISQLVCFLLAFGLSLLSFWLIEYDILLSFSIFSSALLGGVLLPPSLWPDWLIPVMKYNPYCFTISAPAEFLAAEDPAKLHFFL